MFARYKFPKIVKFTSIWDVNNQHFSSGSFDRTFKVDFRFSFAFVDRQLTSRLQPTGFAFDFSLIGKLQAVKDELVFTATQVFDFDAIGRFNCFSIEEKFGGGCLIGNFDLQN